MRGSDQKWQEGIGVALTQDPFGGHLFVFRGRRGDLVKVIWWDGQGACMFMKRLERGRFVWPSAKGHVRQGGVISQMA